MVKKKISVKNKLKSKNPKLTSKVKYNNLEYPYYSLEVQLRKIKKDFEKLKKYKPKLIPKKKNELLAIEENYEKDKDLYLITDYFSQYCRVRCKRDKYSPLEFFQKNKEKIYEKIKKEGEMNLGNIREEIYYNYKQCTNFNVTIVMTVLNYFRPKKWLDFSAGWGDRLVGAIAFNCLYTGVDPSNCMKPIYKKIIDNLARKKDRKNFNIIHDGFEKVKIKSNEYDLVFTSPPFFSLERYEDNEKQSIEQFKTLEEWKTNFLYPCLNKSYEALKLNGYLALYITDFKDNKYISDMKKYIQSNIKGLKYNGTISWINKGLKSKRLIFVWKKT